MIFAPWINDPHGDHQSVSKMATMRQPDTGGAPCVLPGLGLDSAG